VIFIVVVFVWFFYAQNVPQEKKVCRKRGEMGKKSPLKGENVWNLEKIDIFVG
jgi:hypothetical protein